MADQVQDNCCGEENVPYNPKLDPRRKKKSRSAGSLFETLNRRNPFLAQLRDGTEQKKFFEKYPFIPFAGDSKYSGHSLLQFFINIVPLSTTHGSCINRLEFLAFGGKMKIELRDDDLFDTGKEDVDPPAASAVRFIDFIRSIKTNTENIKDLATGLFRDYKATGNAYLILTLTESMGVKEARINSVNPDEALYVKPTQKGEIVKYMAISSYWTDDYIKKNPPEVIPVFPYYSTSADGTKKTIFHIKNGRGWYGRPDSIESVLYQYREYQDATYLIKSADNGFVGQVLIEVEGDDPESEGGIDESKDANAGFDSTASRLEENFTNKGDDPLSILFMERPYGSKAAFVKQFTPNTNENFYSVTGQMSRLNIIQSHQLTERLLGEANANGFSDTAFMQEFELLMPVLEAHQNRIEYYLNTAIDEFAKFAGITEFNDLYLAFQSPYKVINAAPDA